MLRSFVLACSLLACSRTDNGAAATSTSATPTASATPRTSAEPSAAAVVSVAPAAADAGVDRAPHGPLVRATAWVCEDQECEGKPTLAYDYLPAVAADGTVALVEERDGWGHVSKPGIRFVGADGKTAFVPTVTGQPTGSFEVFSKHKREHEAAITNANAELNRRQMRAMFLDPAPKAEVLIGKDWKPSDGAGAQGARVRTRYRTGDVEVQVVLADGHEPATPSNLHEIVVLQAGREVLRRAGKSFADRSGCSARAMTPPYAHADLHTVAFSFTNGMTSHACDGKEEPQVHHVLRW